MRPDVDARFWLAGDEDTGVILHCRACLPNGGGQLIAYLKGISPWQGGASVLEVETIAGLLAEADRHGAATHCWAPLFGAVV